VTGYRVHSRAADGLHCNTLKEDYRQPEAHSLSLGCCKVPMRVPRLPPVVGAQVPAERGLQAVQVVVIHLLLGTVAHWRRQRGCGCVHGGKEGQEVGMLGFVPHHACVEEDSEEGGGRTINLSPPTGC
jgi:hypothetical protein